MSSGDWLTDTRTSYDTVAAGYADLYGDQVLADPWDLALVGLVAGLVVGAGGGPVLDLGCGPGGFAAHLERLGLPAVGIDLSPGMVEIARARHPGVRFEVGSMTDLDVPDASAGGAVLWYSLVHVPDAEIAGVLGEVRRVLRPGGVVLAGFHGGDGSRLKTEGYGGHPMHVHVHQRPGGRVAGWLRDAGFTVDTIVVRDPHADVPQVRVVARVPEVRSP